MKKRLSIAVTLLIIVGIFLVTTPTGVVAEDIVLKWSSYQPPTSPFTVPQKYFAQEIERYSHGKIKVKFYWSESLASGKEMMEAVRDGVSDVVSISASYFRSKVPLTSILDVPFLNVPGQGGRGAILYNRVYLDPIFTEEYDKWNSQFFCYVTALPYNLMGRAPVRTVADLKGKRVRAMGSLGDVLKDFGAIPVFTSAPEAYTSLERGVIDLVAGPGDYWMEAYKVHEAAKYYTIDMDMGANGNIVLISKKAYSKLPDDVKKALPKIREEMVYINQECLASEEKISGYLDKYRAKGIEIIHFPPSERAKLLKHAKEVYWEQWVAEWEKNNVKNVRQALNLVEKTIKDIEKEFPETRLKVSPEIKQRVRELEQLGKKGK